MVECLQMGLCGLAGLGLLLRALMFFGDQHIVLECPILFQAR